MVLELRRRLFAHFQRLPVSFHERYTSGRVISRQVSDIDSISDLFDEGLDSLVSAVFSLLLVGAGMLLLDWPLALVVMAGFAPLTWLTAWFRRESAIAYRRTRETIAQVIVHFVETFGGIRAVQAFRRERRNEEIFGELNADYAAASLRSSRLIAIYSPGITLVGNLAIGAVLLYGGLRVIDGDMQIGRAGHLPALPAALLRPAAGPLAVLQHVPVSRGGAGEDLRCARRGPGRGRAAGPGPASRARGPGPQRANGAIRVGPVRLPRRAGAARPGPDHPGRPDRGHGRGHRRGQDDHRAADGPLLRPGPGPGAAGRHRPPAAVRAVPAP